MRPHRRISGNYIIAHNNPNRAIRREAQRKAKRIAKKIRRRDSQ